MGLLRSATIKVGAFHGESQRYEEVLSVSRICTYGTTCLDNTEKTMPNKESEGHLRTHQRGTYQTGPGMVPAPFILLPCPLGLAPRIHRHGMAPGAALVAVLIVLTCLTAHMSRGTLQNCRFAWQPFPRTGKQQNSQVSSAEDQL